MQKQKKLEGQSEKKKEEDKGRLSMSEELESLIEKDVPGLIIETVWNHDRAYSLLFRKT